MLYSSAAVAWQSYHAVHWVGVVGPVVQMYGEAAPYDSLVMVFSKEAMKQHPNDTMVSLGCCFIAIETCQCISIINLS